MLISEQQILVELSQLLFRQFQVLTTKLCEVVTCLEEGQVILFVFQASLEVVRVELQRGQLLIL